MSTPFDAVLRRIAEHRYHNHRQEVHSDIISDGIVNDLSASCATFHDDLESGAIRIWKNVPSPGDRRRKVDLFVGEPDSDGGPDITKVRIAVENKSVITAHRNATNRFDDLSKVLAAVQTARPQALLIGTVLIGLSTRVLNVPDQVRKHFRGREEEFEREVLPRLSAGDQSLFDEFAWAVSYNREADAAKTLALFRTLPIRGSAETHIQAYDSVLLVPVIVDNVSPPHLPRPNHLGIDVDADYAGFISRTCKAYTARYHM